MHNKEKRIEDTPCALYVHIPFCAQKCFFCSFVVCIARNHRINEYIACLCKEFQKENLKNIKTIYIGGGTPTLLSCAQLDQLIQGIHKNFSVKKNCEFTIETNPDTMDLDKARLLKNLGVNRISIGAQSFNNHFLKFLGRTHQAQDIEKCFSILRKANFSNINLDLMYGFERQTLLQLKKDLSKASHLNGEHLSLYTLTIEAPSRFHRLKTKLPDNQTMRSYYLATLEMLEAKGFAQYEISNFAKPRKQSLHNIAYWRCEDYLGFGVGAHAHINGRRSWNKTQLYPYLQAVKKKKSFLAESEALPRSKRLREALLFGLRMNEGVDIDRLQKRFDRRLPKAVQRKIQEFIGQGFLMRKGQRLSATIKGRLVLDELSIRLI